MIVQMRVLNLVAFLIITSSVFSQKTKFLTDNQFKVLEDKSRSNINSNIDSSFFYANKIEISSKTEHLAFAKGIKAYLFQLKGDTISSSKNYNKALQLINMSKASKEKTRIESLIYNYGGLINWKRSKLNDAIFFFNKGEKLSFSINDRVQEIKFNNNISLVYNEIGKHDIAISIAKNSDELTDLIKKEYTLQEFYRNKSNINLNLGNYYEDFYNLKRDNLILLDSSEYYFKKTLIYSDGLILNKITANISLANISYFRKKYDLAEKRYLSTLSIVKENNLESDYLNLIYNLGDLYFEKKEYNKALLYFKKVDSIYLLNKSVNKQEYIQSNYFQSIIFDSLKNHEKAIYHSDIYFKEYEKYKENLNSEASKINYSREKKVDFANIIEIKRKNESELFNSMIIRVFIGIFILSLVLYIFKIRKEKKKINDKINRLITESNLRKTNENKILTKETESQTINIDKQKELEILDKLQLLEHKKYFLSKEFNQQNVAKKIKTNTTYLSHIVNTNFNKSFSEYANELKINYVIDELLNNPVYRKYSTQAIAESVGFKNAISFTKSFKKRAGVSPTQFIHKIENNN